MTFEGRCDCANLRYEMEDEPVMKARHHCRERQYITGGSSNDVTATPTPGFKLTRAMTCDCCRDCGTRAVTGPQGFPAVFVERGSLDDPKQVGGPQMAICTCDARAFHGIPEDLATFDRLAS